MQSDVRADVVHPRTPRLCPIPRPAHLKTAIIWEADEPGEHVELSYEQLFQEVCRTANILKGMGVKKGDVSLPTSPLLQNVNWIRTLTWHHSRDKDRRNLLAYVRN